MWPGQPLCRALREYRYNIKPQRRASSPFEQLTCAFLYPVPRHLCSDTPCNYKRKEKKCLLIISILIACTHNEACYDNYNRGLQKFFSPTWLRGAVSNMMAQWLKWQGRKYSVYIVNTYICEVIVTAESERRRRERVHLFPGWKQSKSPVFIYFCRYRLVLKLNLDLGSLVDGKAAAFARRECREAWEGWLQSISSPCGGLWWKGTLKGAQTDYGDSQHCTNSSQPRSCIRKAHSDTFYKERVRTIGMFACGIMCSPLLYGLIWTEFTCSFLSSDLTFCELTVCPQFTAGCHVKQFIMF